MRTGDLWALALSVLIVLAMPAPARAHMGSTKYLSVDLVATGVRVIADHDPIDLAYELELADPESGEVAPILERSEDARAWAAHAFAIRSAGGECVAASGPPRAIRLERGALPRPAIRFEIDAQCPEPRTALRLEDRSVFDSDPQHEAFVRIGVGGRSPRSAHAERASVLRRGRQTVDLGDCPREGAEPSSSSSALATFAVFLFEGAIHLVTGYDHVLFLLSLLLVSARIAARDGTRPATRDLLRVVTAFTVGHSVTLSVAALDLVSVPAQLVESGIALSISAVAIWNLARPEQRGALGWVVLAFGLLHGLGFSSVLRALVLPASEQVLALFAFNVGIELAQVAVVLITIPPLAWAARRPWYSSVVVRGGSALIAATGFVWFVLRVIE